MTFRFSKFATPLVLVFVITLFACNQGDERTKFLVKKWTYQEFKMNEQSMSGEQLGNPTMEFFEDGTYKVDFGAMSEEGTWKIEGDNLITESKNHPNPNTLKIIELTENKLKFDGSVEDNSVTLTLVSSKEQTTE